MIVANALNDVRESLYILKREYGQYVDLYNSVTVHDVTTGKKTNTRTKVPIRKAIVLPTLMTTTEQTQTRRPFKYGGYYDTEKRTVIIDSKDVPKTFTVEVDDYIIVGRTPKDKKRYNVISAVKYEFDAGYTLVVEEVKSQPLAEVFEQHTSDKLTISEAVIHA